MRLQSWLFVLYTLSVAVSGSRQWPMSIQQGHLPNDRDVISTPSPLVTVPAPTSDLSALWTPPLSTRGRYIIDAKGNRFRLVGGNWHGASGTWTGRGDINDPSNHHAEEQAFQTPLCLDRVPVEELVQSFLDLGMTTIRLPFSNEMIHSASPPPEKALRANPQFRGMTPLQIFDACIAALTRRGLAVILNNHTVRSMWCCGVDSNSRWNIAQSDQQWSDDWVFMMRRYRDDKRVVGAELYNEVRRDLLSDPTWGSGTYTDWWNASQTVGTRILREANPDALIIVEGINFVGIPTKYTQHWRPELQPVGQLSHAMPVLDKLVYSSHYYAYTGPNATGSDAISEDDPLYRDLSAQQLETTMQQLAFFVSDQPQRHYSAPVWISEFGSAGRTDYLDKDRRGWTNFTDLLIQHDVDFAVWPLLGWQQYGQGDGWAMHMYDADGQRLSILDPGDWRLPDLRKIVNASEDITRTGLVDRPNATYTQLYTRQGSMQQSTRLTNDGTLSQPGAVQASCPDGLRLAGLSYEQAPAALCTDAVFGRDLWSGNGANDSAYIVVTSESSTARRSDWAPDLSKFQCPGSHHIVGFSYDEDIFRSIVCGKTAMEPEAVSGRRTVNFGKSGQLANDRGQWYPIDGKAGTCADDEVMIGVAFARRDDLGKVQALLCENFNGENDEAGLSMSSAAGGPVQMLSWLLVMASPLLVSGWLLP